MEAEPFDAGPFVTCPACKHEHRERETCGTGGSSDDVVLPRADFDAREARLARAEQERDDLARLAYIDHEHRFPDATWKAWCDELVPDLRAATARADALAALLKEARPYVLTVANERAEEWGHVPRDERFLARIDAELEKKK